MFVAQWQFDSEFAVTFGIASKAFKDSRKMDLGALAWVERNNKIMIEGGDGNTISFKGLTYKLVTSPDTGRVWLDRNLGATQVATKVDDSAAYGHLYQWGRAADGHESRTSATTRTLASNITPGTNTFITGSSDWTNADSLGALRTTVWEDGGANDICPTGFSVPTEDEITAETIITNTSTAFSSFLKIPVAGFRHSRRNSVLNNVGSLAFLWSRSVAGGSYGRHFYIYGSSAGFNSDERALGFSVRCIGD